MKSILAAAAVSLTLLAQTSYAQTYDYMTLRGDVQAVAFVKYVNGEYKHANTLIEKLNPFKNQWRAVSEITKRIVAPVDLNGSGKVDTDEEYALFLETYEAEIALLDQDGDGHVNAIEFSVIYDAAEDVSKARGTTLGCDIVVKVGENLNMFGAGEIALSNLVPLYDKCTGG